MGLKQIICLKCGGRATHSKIEEGKYICQKCNEVFVPKNLFNYIK